MDKNTNQSKIIFNKFNVLSVATVALAFTVLGQSWYISSIYAKQNQAIPINIFDPASAQNAQVAQIEHQVEATKPLNPSNDFDNMIASHVQESRKIQAQMNKLFAEEFNQMQISNNLDNELNLFGTNKSEHNLKLKNEPGKLTVTMKLPNMHKDDINVKLNGRLLTISGDVKEKIENTDGTSKQVKQFSSSFTKSITLPEKVQESSLTTEMKNNILTIVMLKESVI